MKTYELYVYDKQTRIFNFFKRYDNIQQAKDKAAELSENGYTGYIKNENGKCIKRF